MIISYLVVKKKFRSKAFIEFVSMLAMAVPARCWAWVIFAATQTDVWQRYPAGLYGTGAILVIVFVVRSLPSARAAASPPCGRLTGPSRKARTIWEPTAARYL
jgi:ABC-type Fe3+ transport system permease subunit